MQKGVVGIVNKCLLLLSFGLVACTNDMNDVKRITYDPHSPDEVSKNISIKFIDNGYAQMNVFASHAESFANPHFTYLKDSLKVDFYDQNGTIESSLTAKYGEIDHDNGKIMVKDSVQFVNHAEKRTMYTTILYWNQLDSIIYTDQNVKIVSEKGVGYGSSFRAKQDFTSYKITDPRGSYEFNQN